jgi:hypothetical protein
VEHVLGATFDTCYFGWAGVPVVDGSKLKEQREQGKPGAETDQGAKSGGAHGEDRRFMTKPRPR